MACPCYEKLVACFKVDEEIDDDEKVEIDDDIYESSVSGSSSNEDKAMNSNRQKFSLVTEKGTLIEHFNVGEQEIRSDSEIGSSNY